jgi:hypothetical protein
MTTQAVLTTRGIQECLPCVLAAGSRRVEQDGAVGQRAVRAAGAQAGGDPSAVVAGEVGEVAGAAVWAAQVSSLSAALLEDEARAGQAVHAHSSRLLLTVAAAGAPRCPYRGAGSIG